MHLQLVGCDVIYVQQAQVILIKNVRSFGQTIMECHTPP